MFPRSRLENQRDELSDLRVRHREAKERILPLVAVVNRRRTLYQGGVMIAHRHHSSRFAFIPLDNVRS